MTLYLRYRRFFWLVFSFLLLSILLLGFDSFFFLTDDAFISFRYISNHVNGLGYVWNPAPFKPVEGYTNFLWMRLLEAIWTVFGVEPPSSCNIVSLDFSLLTLLIAFLIVLKMDLNEKLAFFRVELAFFTVFATVTNTTFLAWTSSGLETALWSFLFTSYIYFTLYFRERFYLWGFLTNILASLMYLTRPDGILYVLLSFFLVAFALFFRFREASRIVYRDLSTLLPLLVVPWHLLWRRSFYGEWLPNTYYAKSVSLWPESGIRYLGAFALEYGLPFWLGAAGFSLYFCRASLGRLPRKILADPTVNKRNILLAIIVVVAVHIGFYTFVIGGDHFEYRIYNHLVAFIYISFIFFIDKYPYRKHVPSALIAVFLVCSYFIPWTHFFRTKDLNSRAETFKLVEPVAEVFPKPLYYYVKLFDDLESWLINHSVGMRHQEHKVFTEFMAAKVPARSFEWGKAEWEARDYPVLDAPCVGILGWRLPNIAIIDTFGLNDYVIARGSVPSDREDFQMAHAKTPPPGYIECFEPNVSGEYSTGIPGIKITKRKVPLTGKRVKACEAKYIE